LALTAPATAADRTTADGPSISAGRLVLTPTDRGYVGTLTATLTNPSPTDPGVELFITEPAGASFVGVEPGDNPCLPDRLERNRVVMHCSANGVPTPGTKTLRFNFHVWTTARDYPMTARGGSIAVGSWTEDGTEITDTARFQTLFRSTTGSLRHPRGYRQATRPDASIRGGNVTLTPRADGTLEGRMPVTVRYGNDAPSYGLEVAANLPPGVVVWTTDPPVDPSFPDSFGVPGGRFLPGEERTFDVVLRAPAGTPAGSLGTGSFTIGARYFPGIPVSDLNPADNTTSFTVRAADAG
ncbi:hypothetical protein, partial [Micromonospora sp. WMMD998]